MRGVDAWLDTVRGVRLPNVFNPYSDICPHYDKPNAAETRFDLLSGVLKQAANRGVDSIWIGRDLGYRGGRRTGLALTDDVHLHVHLGRWGMRPPEAFLKGSSVSERTASVVWAELERINESVFLWNVFPFHPHEEFNEMSNRAHSSRERVLGEELLVQLVDILRPRRLVAVGQNAYQSAVRCTSALEVCAIRHPSYGGQADFIRGLNALYAATE